jgi:hypothetical protein
MASSELAPTEREKKFISSVSEQAADFFASSFTGSDFETLILRSHLWVERQLEKIIENSVNKPNRILESRFNFSNKLAVVRALVETDKNKNLFLLVDSLNKIRNQMAHNIENDKLQVLIKKLNSDIILGENNQLEDESTQKLKITLAQMYGVLIAINELIVLEKEGETITFVG